MLFPLIHQPFATDDFPTLFLLARLRMPSSFLKMLIVVLYAMISVASSQQMGISRQTPQHSQWPSSARVHRRPATHSRALRRSASSMSLSQQHSPAVSNAFPTVRWNSPLQINRNLREIETMDGAMKNDDSILAGSMSADFLKQLSNYLYGLITGRLRQRQQHVQEQSSGRKSNEVLDYEEETRVIDALERAQKLNSAVQAPPQKVIETLERAQKMSADLRAPPRILNGAAGLARIPNGEVRTPSRNVTGGPGRAQNPNGGVSKPRLVISTAGSARKLNEDMSAPSRNVNAASGLARNPSGEVRTSSRNVTGGPAHVQNPSGGVSKPRLVISTAGSARKLNEDVQAPPRNVVGTRNRAQPNGEVRTPSRNVMDAPERPQVRSEGVTALTSPRIVIGTPVRAQQPNADLRPPPRNVVRIRERPRNPNSNMRTPPQKVLHVVPLGQSRPRVLHRGVTRRKASSIAKRRRRYRASGRV